MSEHKPPARANASGYHKKVLKVCREAYPRYTILEEMYVTANDRGRPTKLPIDIFIKELSVAIEVQGEQHFAFNTRFHKTTDSWKSQQARDRAKEEAVLANGWSFLAIPHHDIETLTSEELTKRVLEAMKASNE